jgi:hypothetical protein
LDDSTAGKDTESFENLRNPSVKLHQEFQIGPHEKNDHGSFLGRVDIVLGAIKTPVNLTALKARGWTDGEINDFQDARDSFGPAEQYREQSKGGAKGRTAERDADASALYDSVLTIQNAADLEWPATDPANAGVLDEFRLGLFPPNHGGNNTPAPAPTPEVKPSK